MSDQTKLDALTVTHRLTVIGALAALLDSPQISDRDELTLRNAVRLMRNDLDAVEAINALEFLAREGYGPSFTQRAVMVGARAAMGTGDDSTSFRAACRALAYTTSPEYAAANQDATKGRACRACGHGGAVPHVPGCVMTLLPPTPTPAPGGACPSCGEGRPGAAHRPGCNMIAPLPRSLVIDDPVVAWDGFFQPGKFLKTKGDDWVAYEFFMTPTMSKRVEFPSRWFFDAEMRKEMAQILRDARNDARNGKIGR